MFLICFEFCKVFGYFLEIRCDDAGIINYYLYIYLFDGAYCDEHRAVVHSRGVVPGDFNLRIWGPLD